MVDQIIDRKTVGMPGPQGITGKQGPIGLPGVNAVENDQAVAGYINAPESATNTALNHWRKPINVVEMGVDNTGTTDVVNQIQEIVNQSDSILFPPGLYKISKPIKLPYNTYGAYTMYARGARFQAAEEMSEMVTVGGFDHHATMESNWLILEGGYFDCNGLAKSAIRINSICNHARVKGVLIRNAIETGISCAANGCQFYDVEIWNDKTFADGIRFVDGANDNLLNGIKLMYVTHGISLIGSNGDINVTDLYVWSGFNPDINYGIYVKNNINPMIVVTNTYLDTLNYGVFAETSANLIINGAQFYYSGTSGYNANLYEGLHMPQAGRISLGAHAFYNASAKTVDPVAIPDLNSFTININKFNWAAVDFNAANMEPRSKYYELCNINTNHSVVIMPFGSSYTANTYYEIGTFTWALEGVVLPIILDSDGMFPSVEIGIALSNSSPASVRYKNFRYPSATINQYSLAVGNTYTIQYGNTTVRQCKIYLLANSDFQSYTTPNISVRAKRSCQVNVYNAVRQSSNPNIALTIPLI